MGFAFSNLASERSINRSIKWKCWGKEAMVVKAVVVLVVVGVAAVIRVVVVAAVVDLILN